MEFIVLLVIIVFFAGFVFVNMKINNLKYRTKQQLLKNTGVSSSEVDSGIRDAFEKKYLEKFLAEYTNFTEESIKDLLKQYTINLINKEPRNEFSQTVYEKMQKDAKLEKLKSMEFKKLNISSYGNSRLSCVSVYTDNRDEYKIYLYCSIQGDRIQLDRYQIEKGAIVGF